MSFKNLNEMLVAVKNAAQKKPHPELLPVSNVYGNSTAAYAIPETFSKTLLDRALSSSRLAGRCTIIEAGDGTSQVVAPQINQQSAIDGCRYQGAAAGWIPEGESIPEILVPFTRNKYPLQKLAVAVRVSSELTTDFPGFSTWIEKAISESFACKLDEAILSGSGIGMPLGILKSDSLIAVEKEAEQTAGTIVLKNILSMVDRFDSRSWPDAAWFCNQSALKQLYYMATADGAPVLDLSTGTMLGKPIFPCENSPAIGNVGDILLADMSQYSLCMRQMDSVISIHVYFLTGENSFRFILQAQGMPIWGSPILPLHGGNTVSPFVAIAERA